MSKIKIDFKLSASPLHQAALDSVKVGDVLDVKPDEAALADATSSCHTAAGAVAGVVPPEAQRRFPSATPLTATVRSVQRDASTASVAHLLLRVELSEFGAALPVKAAVAAPTSAGHDDIVDFEHQLRRSQLESLVGDKELGVMLRDPRLQHLLTQIDGSQSREKAIDNALEQVDFRAFADQVLAAASPPLRAPGA